MYCRLFLTPAKLFHKFTSAMLQESAKFSQIKVAENGKIKYFYNSVMYSHLSLQIMTWQQCQIYCWHIIILIIIIIIIVIIIILVVVAITDKKTNKQNKTKDVCQLCPLVASLSRSLGVNPLVYQMHVLINLVPPCKSLANPDTQSYTAVTLSHCLCSDRQLVLVHCCFRCMLERNGWIKQQHSLFLSFCCRLLLKFQSVFWNSLLLLLSFCTPALQTKSMCYAHWFLI